MRDPRDARAWLALGLAARDAGEKEGALRVAASLGPLLAAPLWELTRSRLAAGSADAVELARRAVAVDPGTVSLGLSARALCAAGDTAGASRALDAARSRVREGSAAEAFRLKREMPARCNAPPPTPGAEVAWQPQRAAPAPDAACAARRLAPSPSGASGVVFAEYVVGEDGKVQAWSALSGEETLSRAVQAFLGDCHFLSPSGPVRVTQPFIFPGAP